MAEAQLKNRKPGSVPGDAFLSAPALQTQNAVVREVGGYHFANDPNTGALSVLNTAELMAFQRLGNPGGVEEAEAFFRQLGQSQSDAAANTQRLVTRLTRDGWTRTALPKSTSLPLSSVYFTLTRECDLACPYCYQGLRKRARKIMPLEHVHAIMDKIAAINPDSHIMVTGGEPMLHPNFFEILESIRDQGFTPSVLTNGGLIDEAAAERLAAFGNIERVQVSIDGICEETHAMTRGPRSFDKSMAGIHALARHKVPLLLAPTIHDGNADEILDLARLAIDLGGSISANDLKQLPQDENTKITLAPDTLRRVKAELSDFLTEMFGKDDGLRDRI
ncbi:MAG: radical SAM protein, partial [Alphaproteobacteria bacterium]|nr:radical SAM protein [Alphaproteobacteria bacterium]